MPEYLTTLLSVFIALHVFPVAFILGLRLLSMNPDEATKEILKLAISEKEKKAAILSIEESVRREKKTLWYDATAPVVTFYVLLFTEWSANKLPSAFKNWDNNVSLNGDGFAVFRNGKWLNLRGNQLLPGEVAVSYDDPEFEGSAYYCKGWHPRSWLARWVWVGWRNRASKMSEDLGVVMKTKPECISGELNIGRTKPGHFLLKCGEHYHYKSFKKKGLVVLIRSVGFKLEYYQYAEVTPQGYGIAPTVLIGRSFKGAK